MYKKGVAIEIQFAPDRLVNTSIQLDENETRALFDALSSRIDNEGNSMLAPAVVDLVSRTKPAPVLATSGESRSNTPAAAFKQWVCVICGWIYDEETGCPEEGIEPGTRFEAIPDDWRCPLCDVGKEDFAVVEF